MVHETDPEQRIYQSIAEAILRRVPADWIAAKIEAELFEDAGGADFFYIDQSGVEKLFDPGFSDFDVVDQAFVTLRADGRSR